MFLGEATRAGVTGPPADAGNAPSGFPGWFPAGVPIGTGVGNVRWRGGGGVQFVQMKTGISRGRRSAVFWACLSLGMAGSGVWVDLTARAWDLQGETMVAEDLGFWTVEARGEGARGERRYDFSAQWTHYGLDYQPAAFDALGAAVRRTEDRQAVSANVEGGGEGNWGWLGNLYAYRGFGDFQSIWLAEYYRQQFSDLSGPGFDTYEEPDPQGWGGSAGARWRPRRTGATLEARILAAGDTLAPGYEIDFTGLRQGLEEVTSFAYRGRWEQIVNRRLRTVVEGGLTDTTGRELRGSTRGQVFASLGRNLTLRGEAGATWEEPDFEAWFAAVAAEWSWSRSWTALAALRIYEDTGELQNDGLFSTAAPALRNQSASFGVRWGREGRAWRLMAGYLRSDYEEGNPDLDFFQNLYRDREFFQLQLAYSHEI